MVTTDGSQPVWLHQNTPMVVTHTKNRNKTGLQLMARVSKLMNVSRPIQFCSKYKLFIPVNFTVTQDSIKNVKLLFNI